MFTIWDMSGSLNMSGMSGNVYNPPLVEIEGFLNWSIPKSPCLKSPIRNQSRRVGGGVFPAPRCRRSITLFCCLVLDACPELVVWRGSLA